MTVFATSGRALAALMALAPFTTNGLAATTDWNARISLVEVFTSMPGAKGGALLADENLASVFHVGQLVDIVCHYQYTKVGSDGVYPGFSISFHARGSIFDTKAVAQSTAPFKSVWSSLILKEEGTYNLGCRINATDADVDDNTGKRQITVLAAKPGEAGWLPAPAPQVTSPGAGQVFILTPTLSVPVKARVPAKPFANQSNFLEYAKKTADVERWHMEIVRVGSGQFSAFETKVAELKGELDTIEFGEQLTAQWFEQHGAGPGHYALRTWITQQRQDGTYVGPSARVDFRLAEGKAATANAPPPVAQASPPSTPVGSAAGRVGPGVPAPGPSRSPAPRATGTPGSALGQTQLPAVQSPSRGAGAASAARAPGLERCEALKRQNKVDQCALTGRVR